jgi:predicted metal-dependent peptidase
MIDERMRKARSELILAQPFYGALAMRLVLQEWTGNDTMATDGTTLFYSKQFLDQHPEEIITFAVAHEVSHCAMKHHTRRNNRDPKLWNIAADHVINNMLRRTPGFKCPEWAICDARFHGMSVDEVYRILQDEMQKPEPQPQPNEPQDDAGEPDDNSASGDKGDENEASDSPSANGESGDDDDSASSDQPDGGPPDDGEGDSPSDADAGEDHADDDENEADANKAASSEDDSEPADGAADQENGEHEASGNGPSDQEGNHAPQSPASCGDPGGCGEVLDAAPAHDPGKLAEIEAEWEVATRQAVNVARRQAGGTPGHLQSIVDDLNKPRVDWREVMRRFVDPSATRDYTWRMPNRRFLATGDIIPGLIDDGVHHVVWITDTSGSIDKIALQQCRAEVQAALDEGAIDKLTVLDCDAKVQRTAVFEKGDLVQFTSFGGGGTEFQPAWDWIEKNVDDAACAVYFTDLCPNGDKFGRDPGIPVLWAAYGHPQVLKMQMPKIKFGEIIDVGAH